MTNDNQLPVRVQPPALPAYTNLSKRIKTPTDLQLFIIVFDNDETKTPTSTLFTIAFLCMSLFLTIYLFHFLPLSHFLLFLKLNYTRNLIKNIQCRDKSSCHAFDH